MCADTTVQEEEEEDPSDGKSDYASDEDAILSDLSFGNSFTSSFSPITNTNGGAYNQVNQEELQSDFNIPYNKGDSPTSLSPINTNMRNCDELPTAIVTLLPLVLLLASLENKVFQYGIYR